MAPNTASLSGFEARLPNLSRFPLEEVLALIRTPNVGPATFYHLLNRYSTPFDALERLPAIAQRGGGNLKPCTLAKAKEEIDRTHRFGARLVVYGGKDYPAGLLTLPDPPPVLSLSGDAKHWQARPLLAVVGSRNASANGCALAKTLSMEAGKAGIGIVSGLARGIDTAAHMGALPYGTIGVIAGGIDNIYPPENKKLYAEMRERGAVVSEQPIGQSPYASAFPARNRIIAGMSLATLVVEASPKSGSLITARLAGEQGREVLAIPGSPLDPRSRGCNQLLKNGATLVEDIDDIRHALQFLHHTHVQETPAPYLAHFTPADTEITEARHALLAALSPTPTPLERILVHTGLPHALTLEALLELELAGAAMRLPGGGVCLKL